MLNWQELQSKLDSPETRIDTLLWVSVRLRRTTAIVSAIASGSLGLFAWFDVGWGLWVGLPFCLAMVALYLLDWFWLAPMRRVEEAHLTLRLRELLQQMELENDGD